MRALVAGGAGFIGSTLVDRLLAEGHAVDVIDDLSTGTLANLADARSDRSNELRFHHADVRSAEVAELIARRAPEVVFSLVGAAGAPPARAAEVHVVGAVNVLEGARAGGAAKVVFVSSQGPLTPATIARAAVVDYLTAYRDLHELEFAMLALATVYGPRQAAGVVATFVRAVAAGEPCTIFGDGEQTRDFVFVDDVVDALVRAGERGSGLVVDIGTGVETSINDLHRLVAGPGDRPLYEPPPAPEPRRVPVDPGRAAMYLGWKPWTPLADGVRQLAV